MSIGGAVAGVIGGGYGAYQSKRSAQQLNKRFKNQLAANDPRKVNRETLQGILEGFEYGLSRKSGGAKGGQSMAERLSGTAQQQKLDLTRRFGPELLALQQQLNEQAISGDPLASSMRKTSMEALGGYRALQGIVMQDLRGMKTGGLPSDLERAITERSRQRFASAGLIGGPQAAIGEVSALMGGSEQIRARRLATAQNVLGSGTGIGARFTNVPQQGMISSDQYMPTAQGMGTLGAQNRQTNAQQMGWGMQGAAWGAQQQQSGINNLTEGMMNLGQYGEEAGWFG